MDGGRSSGVATFFCNGPLVVGSVAELSESEAHHARVRRFEEGTRVRLVDGVGSVADGVLVKLAKRGATADVEQVTQVSAPPAFHLLPPIGDRDRMLWLAEKATELGLTTWRAVMWRRSRGVAPRGEGEGFHTKLRARMIAALTQSGGAWLPRILPDMDADALVEATLAGWRVLLDPGGEPLLSLPLGTPITIALGPEGGLEADERERLVTAGWIPASLGSGTLRFETAAIAGLAIARAAVAANVENARG